MKVICFGDSNTYGYDPRSYFGGRYEPECRWVDILGVETGWTVINVGMNGREIPSKPIKVAEDSDLLLVMLGTNDLLQGNAVSTVVRRMESFLSDCDPAKVVLIAPPPMQRGEWVPSKDLIDRSGALAQGYRALAKRLGAAFADAGKWDIPMAYDGVHFTEEGHKAFARGLLEALRR